ncbi:MAG: protease HtpX [Proteobacteria bacterium]|nr:protease HtpX [Pseudomonadota bacterium]
MNKRVVLFLMVNLMFMLTISIIVRLTSIGVNSFAPDIGVYTYIAIISLVVGFGGAFFSLLISRWMAKKAYGVKVIDPNLVSDPVQQRLVKKVHQFASDAGLAVMPEVGIYQDSSPNAFATGPSKRKSLVAVSSGLLESMTDSEVEGVLAHEIAHIANDDMVTMTLLQGVVNSFVFFLAYVITMFLFRGSKNGGRLKFFLVRMCLEMVLGILGAMVVYWFSRHREYRADTGGAQLCGHSKMMAALKKLQLIYDKPLKSLEQQRSRYDFSRSSDGSIACMKISSEKKMGSQLAKLFSTHPPMADRIARLSESSGY